ncbi:MAG: hypothetical protein V4547_16705 [Bacteroidota bacterium]
MTTRRILTFTFILINFAFCSCSIGNCKQFIKNQKRVESEYTKISDSFQNELLQKDVRGLLYSLMTRDSVEFVMVKWTNGNYSIGGMQNKKVYGKWYTYDNRNRLRTTLAFLDQGTLLFITHYNKKGKKIYHSENSAPF